MTGPLVVIFHQSPRDGEPPLTALLAAARQLVMTRHVDLFRRAGVRRVVVVSARDQDRMVSFGERLAGVVAEERPRRGIIVLGGGAVPLLRHRDVAHLVGTAGGPRRSALTNNRFSSDVCALSDAMTLRELPSLPTDNALPRWLEVRAGYRVRELPGRARLALDLDTPLDLALVAMVPGAPAELRRLARGIAVPRLDGLRTVAADPQRELLVAGRTSAGTLRWLERHAACRVRGLLEERGLKASSRLALAPGAGVLPVRPPRSTIGRLLAVGGPGQLATIVGELADGAIIDSRVLLADRLGADERSWPSAEDRFRSDLLLPDGIEDAWLAELTRAAAMATMPILLGAHTVVGPGVRILLGRHSARRGAPGTRPMLR